MENQTKINDARNFMSRSKVIPESLKAKWLERIKYDSKVSIQDQVKELEDEVAEVSMGVTGKFPEGYKADDAANEVDADEVIDDVLNSLM
ncbi:hypothetical protein [Tamlana sp. I1]|uniref:hypothetical protein n=1 Tax=Tamlana sp. I1 TaxID=2762061 RepID=UPI0018901610|nr:hypothetical protein [Tamlana sp. I1]